MAVLLRHGAEVDTGSILDDNMTALHAAAVAGNLPVVQILLENRADANRRLAYTGEDTAQLAEENDHLEIARFYPPPPSLNGVFSWSLNMPLWDRL